MGKIGFPDGGPIFQSNGHASDCWPRRSISRTKEKRIVYKTPI
jgi:hypothetical protein